MVGIAPALDIVSVGWQWASWIPRPHVDSVKESSESIFGIG